MALQPSQLAALHKLSSHHRDQVLGVGELTCFYCCKNFPPKKIKEWCDSEQTAICPLCGIDAVLPFNLGTEALKEMHEHWFRVVSGKGYQMKKGKAFSRNRAVVLEDDKVDLNDLAYRTHALAVEKGFWDDCKEEPGLLTNIASKVALIHAEVTEALEEYRSGHPLDETRIEDGKPEGFGVELADVIIRTVDLAQRAGVNIGALVNLKFRYNESRPTRHGKKF
jgi:NTP pyrophosphatase (non-canonical NTP hydrolase)